MTSVPATRNGHLVIIGGGEDRVDDKEVLTRFVELAGGTVEAIRGTDPETADRIAAAARREMA